MARTIKCFVVGCSRSGTTLLSVMLDRHSHLAMTPETAFYRDLAASFREGTRPRAIKLLSEWERLPELGLTVQAVIEACGGDFTARRVFGAILELYAQARGERHCGEKTPGHFRHVPEMLADFPDARVLFLMRDGRDVALSLATMPFWQHGLTAAANLWIEAAQTCHKLLDSGQDRLELIRYGDLAAHPQAVMHRIMSTLSLTTQPEQFDARIPSGVILPRSMAWKERALQTVDCSRIGYRQKAASDKTSRFLMA